jgi:hypothetical protein
MGQAAVIFAFVWAVLAGPLVGGLEWLSFKTAASIGVGLFGLGALLLMAGAGLQPGGGLCYLVLAGGLGGGLYLMPAPPGSPERKPPKPVETRLIVTVTDEQDKPIGRADVYLAWKPEGARDPKDRGDSRVTYGNGQATFTTLEDPTDRVAILRVYVDSGGYEQPRIEVHGIRPGETREVPITVYPLRSRSANAER